MLRRAALSVRHNDPCKVPATRPQIQSALRRLRRLRRFPRSRIRRGGTPAPTRRNPHPARQPTTSLSPVKFQNFVRDSAPQTHAKKLRVPQGRGRLPGPQAPGASPVHVTGLAARPRRLSGSLPPPAGPGCAARPRATGPRAPRRGSGRARLRHARPHSGPAAARGPQRPPESGHPPGSRVSTLPTNKASGAAGPGSAARPEVTPGDL